MSLANLLAAINDEASAEGRAPAMAPDLLLDYAKDYQRFLAGCPFAAGDLVTPRKDSAIKGPGKPHVVLETRTVAAPHFIDSPGSNAHGTRQDMRVASYVGNEIVPHWVESFQFEPFKRDA